jgi:hypothetical protein
MNIFGCCLLYHEHHLGCCLPVIPSSILSCGPNVACRLGGEGGRSDLTVVIEQQLHPSFRRLADDLYVLVSVPLVTALTGGPVQLRTLGGHLLQLPVDDNAVITPGSELVVPDQGMPVFGDLSGRRGVLHVKFKVNFPQHLSQQQQLLLRHALAGCEFPSLMPQADPGPPQLERLLHPPPQQPVPQMHIFEQQVAEEQPQSAQQQQRWRQQHTHISIAHQQFTAFASGSAASSSSSYLACAGVSGVGYQVGSNNSSVAGFACINSSASSRQVGICSNDWSAAAAAATAATAAAEPKDMQQLQQEGAAGQPTDKGSSQHRSHVCYSTSPRW